MGFCLIVYSTIPDNHTSIYAYERILTAFYRWVAPEPSSRILPLANRQEMDDKIKTKEREVCMCVVYVRRSLSGRYAK